MRTVRIPGTDLAPSALCLGTNRFGTAIPEGDAFVLLDAFVEMGGAFIDTAHIYADWLPGAPPSASENTIGRWLTARGNRSTLTVATKGAHPDLRAMNVSRLSPAELTADLTASLKNLATDHVDLYWLHRDDRAIPVGDIIEPLEELARQGLLRYYGCSNWRVDRIAAAEDYAAQHRLKGFVGNQPQWSLARANQSGLSDPEGLVIFGDDDYRLHLHSGLAVMPWSSQGQGFFEKLTRGGVDGLGEGIRKTYLNETNLERAPRVAEVADRHGASVNAVSLAYLLCQPFATIPVVGPRTTEQLRDSIQALDVSLTAAELEYLRSGTIL